MTLANNYSARQAALTTEDRAIAQKLKSHWNSFRNKDPASPITQEEAATALGIKQGPFAQFLNGLTRAPDGFVLNFARYVGVQPGEINEKFNFLSIPKNRSAISCTETWSGKTVRKRDIKIDMDNLIAFDLKDCPELREYKNCIGLFKEVKNGNIKRDNKRYKLVGLIP